MDREDLRDLIRRIVAKMRAEADGEGAPVPACVFGDQMCDASTEYAVGEEG